MDVGDKAAASLSYKKNLGNYESMDFYCSATLCKREGESDEDFWHRVWKMVEDQLDAKVEEAENLLKGNK